jgi:hypothetical protein
MYYPTLSGVEDSVECYSAVRAETTFREFLFTFGIGSSR